MNLSGNEITFSMAREVEKGIVAEKTRGITAEMIQLPALKCRS